MLKLRKRPDDGVLFLTHTPEAYPVGRIWEQPEHWGGGQFVVTRLVRLAPTALLNGGLAACYEVRGRATA
jgi:hypothetical protein